VCIDGGDPDYLNHGLSRRLIPTIGRFMNDGFHEQALGTMPSFTCPNNVSIVTGAPPAMHGISGNYHLDRATGVPVVMTGPELLRTRSIMAELSLVGAHVVSITAKDKLRAQLQKGMDIAGGRAISFSSQHADRCTLEENGIEDVLDWLGRPLPDMYSPDLSLFVLDAGIELLRHRRPDVMYLSLSDLVQHAHTPDDSEAEDFYRDLDDRIGQLAELGAVIGLIADHGMTDMSQANGSPRVIWLQEILDEAFGNGTTTVICPITDAFVGHHGALGGFVRVYCHGGCDPERARALIGGVPGIARVWSRTEAVEEMELPYDVEADVAVMAVEGTAIGTRAAHHDLSALKGKRLRSHGSRWEADVPFILSEPLIPEYANRAAVSPLRSHHIFDFAINGVD
jgi:phosphonoacetate hydrolase